MRKGPAGPTEKRKSRTEVLTPAIGCDLGGTNLKLVRLGSSGVEQAVEVPTPAGAGAVVRAAIVNAIVEHTRALLPGTPGRVPLGIAVPGFLDPARERILCLSNLPALNGVCLGREVTRRLGRVCVVLDADTNAAALAEARLGSGRNRERVLFVTMGTGLGAALVLGGEVVRVSRHTVGQVAHLPLGARGPRCYCGAVGCAETLLSARGIAHRAARAGFRASTSPRELFEAALHKSADRGAARAVWLETGELLGRLLQMLAALFSPDVIVVGGGVAGAATLFVPAARRTLWKSLTPRLRPRVAVEPALLGRHAGAIGAALLAGAAG